jgi:hypothetical protein
VEEEVIRTFLALFRIGRLLRLEATVHRVIEEVDAHDGKLNGTPPHHNDSKSPDGDDYNKLWSIIGQLRDEPWRRK